VSISDRPHADEHALEVQLPFLQAVLRDFNVVPLVVGEATGDEVAVVLDRLWGGPETLIVVSSDLSHYLPYEAARRVDAATLQRVLSLDPGLDHQQACGATPINGLMQVARRRGLRPRLLAACTSGDTAGDRDRVVGYAALAFSAANDASAARDADNADEGVRRGATLLAHARHAVESLFRADGTPLPDAPFLDQPGACFVTLRVDGELRGCIGSLEAQRTLREDIAANARAAALRDPRFAPLAEHELASVSIEVSVLSPAQSVAFSDEADLLRQLDIARDGIVLECGRHRATFLPQVWEQLPDAREFLLHLKAKAGLAPGFWSPDIRVWRYAVDKWCEQ
jgi:AmmeMemoRadiSam system protein A